MGFFDFITSIPPYSENAASNVRLNKRHQMIVAPFRGQLQGARVLDLAAHDGRWSYALAEAGAAEVIGIEARQELVDRFDNFPESEFKDRVELRQGDLFEALEEFIETGDTFDVVALYGIYYHIMDHFRVLQLIRKLGAGVILIDSEFALRPGPIIELVFERTDDALNAAPQYHGQDRAIIGIPSFKAMESMAHALDYDVVWTRTKRVFGDDTKGIQDYFRPKIKRRAFCTLIKRS